MYVKPCLQCLCLHLETLILILIPKALTLIRPNPALMLPGAVIWGNTSHTAGGALAAAVFHLLQSGNCEVGKALSDHRVQPFPALPRPPLTHVPKCPIHRAFKFLQRWGLTPALGSSARAGQPFPWRNNSKYSIQTSPGPT